jgi:uracil-DNA glycosylase
MKQLNIFDDERSLVTTRRTKLEVLFTARDTSGNFLIYSNGDLYLRLESEDRNRKIGKLGYVGNMLVYSKFDDESQIHRATNSWSIPLLVAHNIDIICIKTPKREYWIGGKLALHVGSILKFNGYERKLYVPVHVFEESLFNEGVVEDVKEDITESDQKMINRMGFTWQNLLKSEFSKDYYKKLMGGLNSAKNSGKIIYPPAGQMFRAFKLTPYDKVKVVIFGQDPYSDGSATGLAFSVENDSPLRDKPPSIQKICEAAEKEFPNHFSPAIMTGDLSGWAEQGVLLLNTALSVSAGNPGKHVEHWRPFTKAVIEQLNQHPETIVFMLWGAFAKELKPLISSKHRILEAEHPVYAARQNRTWDNNNCFTVTNKILEEVNRTKINW